MENNTKISIKKDGNQWCVLWGENLQEGIAGFGDTPEEAMDALAWTISARLEPITKNGSSKIYIDINKLTAEYRQKLYQQQEDKIQQLEKENAELNTANTRLRGSKFYLQKENEEDVEFSKLMMECRDEAVRETSKLQKEIADLKKQIDESMIANVANVCLCKERDEFTEEIIRLKMEVNKLDEGIHHHKDPHWKMFQDVQNHLQKENADLQSKVDELLNESFEKNDVAKLKLIRKIEMLENKLVNIKCLNRQEVEHIIGSINYNEDKISAILHLAVPEVDRDKLIKIINDNFYIESGDFTDHLLVYDEVVKQDDVPDKDEAKALLVSYIADEIIKSIGGKNV